MVIVTKTLRSSIKDYIDVSVKNVLTNNEYRYEIIQDDTYIRPYFDIDLKTTTEGDEFDGLKKETLKKYKQYIKNIFVGLVQDVDLSISDSSQTGFKISYHIIVSNIKTTKTDLRNLSKTWDKKEAIDPAVYNQGQQKFRIVLKSKEGEDRILTPITNKNKHKRHLITICDDNDPTFKYDIQEQPKKEKEEEKQDIKNPNEKITFDELKCVVDKIENDKFVSFNDWSNITWAIYNISSENGYLKKGKELIHDVSKKAPEQYDEEKVEKFIDTQCKHCDKGYHMGTLKRMINDVKTKNGENKKSYENVKKEFDKICFKINDPVCYCETVNLEDSNGNLIENKIVMKSKEKFVERWRNKKYIDAKGKEKQFINRWLEDENIKEYKEMNFYPPPARVPQDIYNTFGGLLADKITDKAEDPKIILDHVKLLCNDDDDIYNYVLNWLAQIIQYSGELSRVALVLHSDQEGTGKNLFFEWFGDAILGKSYLTSTNEVNNTLLDKHANGLINKLLIVLSDNKSKDNWASSERIKSIITDQYIREEKKGIDAQNKINNFGRWVFLTNQSNVVKISHNDRRFMAWKMTTKKESSYFSNLAREMKKLGIQKGFYDFLKNRDISKVNFETDRPKTEFYQELQDYNCPTVARFLEDLTYKIKEDSMKIKADELFQKFKEWQYETNHKYECTSTGFGKTINEYKGVEKGARTSKGFFYNLQKIDIMNGLIDKGYVKDTVHEASKKKITRKTLTFF
jgi:hypothetical protein